jgi:group I intron endonuclease
MFEVKDELRKEKMVIYQLTNIVNDKIYIGQTIQTLDARLSAHRSPRIRNKSPIANAIRTYGSQYFTVEILRRCKTISELNRYEKHYISSLKSLWPRGYNLDSGGCNKKLHKITKIKCKIGFMKIKEKHKAIMNSPDMKQLLSERTISGIYQKEGEIERRKIDMAKKNNNPSFMIRSLMARFCEFSKGQDGEFYYNTGVWDLVTEMYRRRLSIYTMSKILFEEKMTVRRISYGAMVNLLDRIINDNYPKIMLDNRT